jgi:DNA-binding transcriptional MerR regulator
MTLSAGLDQAGLTVAGLAAEVGVGRDTIRYYERVGLLPPPPRTVGDHRRYPAEAIDRLRFIQGCQRLGLRLEDIGNLLEVRDTGACACTPANELLKARLTELDAEVERLRLLRSDLTTMLGRLASDECPDPAPGTWCSPGGR